MNTVTNDDTQKALAAVDEEIRRTILAMGDSRGEDLDTLARRLDRMDSAYIYLSQARASDSWI